MASGYAATLQSIQVSSPLEASLLFPISIEFDYKSNKKREKRYIYIRKKEEKVENKEFPTNHSIMI